MKSERLFASVCAGAALMTAGAQASAASYIEGISADPSSFTCKPVANGLKTCGAYTVFEAVQPAGGSGQYNGGSGFFTANPGDSVTVEVSYSSPMFVPNAKNISLVYVDLYDFNSDTQVASLPQKTADVYSVLTNYRGPPNPYFAFQESFYGASAGHYFTAGNPGAFSIDGIDSTFQFVEGDALPIVLAAYGYEISVPEPATWAMMLLGFGGLGAALRTARKRALLAS